MSQIVWLFTGWTVRGSMDLPANHIQRATTAREDTYLLERRRIRYISTSGSCASGATWTFDYRTRELHISGSTMKKSEFPDYPYKKVIFEKDFVPPENNNSQADETNDFVFSFVLRPHRDSNVYCYPNSPFANEYEKIKTITDEEDGTLLYADIVKCNISARRYRHLRGRKFWTER